MTNLTLNFDDDLYDRAARVAKLDNVSVGDLVESVMRRHVDYVESFEGFSKTAPLILDNYDLVRDPGESEEDYSFRRSLFR